MATRHQVRCAVITFLYAHEMDTFSEDFASEYLSEQKIKNEQRAYAYELFSGVLDNILAIDTELNLRLTTFKLSELGAMERAILRLGAHEILAAKCDARVAISEAVMLASEFGTDSAPKLINGVLNSIYKGEKPEPKEQSEAHIPNEIPSGNQKLIQAPQPQELIVDKRKKSPALSDKRIPASARIADKSRNSKNDSKTANSRNSKYKKDGKEPSRKSGAKSGFKSGFKTGEKSGAKSAGKTGFKAGARSNGSKPTSRTGAKPAFKTSKKPKECK